MKDTLFLYAISIIAVILITAVFICYATDTLPKHTPRARHVIRKTPTPKKKDCPCCPKKIDAALKRMEQQLRKNRNTDELWGKIVDKDE